MVDYRGRPVGANVSNSNFLNCVNKYGDKVDGMINMQENSTVNLPNPTIDFDAATKSYVDTTSNFFYR